MLFKACLEQFLRIVNKRFLTKRGKKQQKTVQFVLNTRTKTWHVVATCDRVTLRSVSQYFAATKNIIAVSLLWWPEKSLCSAKYCLSEKINVERRKKT